MPIRIRLMRMAALVILLLLIAGAGAHPGRASDADVTAAQDNPPGCTKATGEDNDGCGAKGRDHFSSAAHRAPVDACRESVAPSGSTITRVLPDGPRRPDGALAFISGACVYLPPGYATSGLRYPVVHVLHGGGGDQADWVTFGNIRAILDRAYAADPRRAVIAVISDGRSGQWYDYENRTFLIESYVLDHLVPYVDRHFRTIPDRSARAVVGLSNGGYGATHFAAKRPDLFIAAGGMSSNIGARTLSGLGADGAVHHQGSVPYQLAENYDEVDLVLDVANYCTAPDPYCATIAVDLAFTPDHLAFNQRMADIAHRGDLDFRQADGAHQFKWWSKWLEERQLPFLQQRLVDPIPATATAPVSRIPAEFRYRSIKPRFSVWGYDVAVERNVREFLDLRAVTAGGFQVQGSGRAQIVTAAYYAPGASYAVLGTRSDPAPLTLVAGTDGRLTIPVDLGPSHTHDQFTDDADVAAARGNYWTVRTVTIAEAGGDTPLVAATTPPVPVSTFGYAHAGGSFGMAGEATRAAESGAVAPAAPSPPAGVVATIQRAVAPIAAAVTGPQLVPTVLFLAVLALGPALWWRRRQRNEAAEESGAAPAKLDPEDSP